MRDLLLGTGFFDVVLEALANSWKYLDELVDGLSDGKVLGVYRIDLSVEETIAYRLVHPPEQKYTSRSSVVSRYCCTFLSYFISSQDKLKNELPMNEQKVISTLISDRSRSIEQR